MRKESASRELSPLPVWKAVSLLGYYDPLGYSTEIAALAVEEQRAAPSASAASAVGGPDGAARPRDVSLARIHELLDEYITQEDGKIFEFITGTPLHELRRQLLAAPNVTVDRFLSSDRWVYSELNAKGLHMLRCILAERVVNERRHAARVTEHPDYASFMRDGFLIKVAASHS